MDNVMQAAAVGRANKRIEQAVRSIEAKLEMSGLAANVAPGKIWHKRPEVNELMRVEALLRALEAIDSRLDEFLEDESED